MLVSFEGAEEDLVNSVISVLDSGREKFLFQEIQFQSKIWHKGIAIDLKRREVVRDNRKIELTYTEFEILQLLAQNPGRVFSKEQIYDIVWKESYFGDYNIVMSHISHIREKIEDDQMCIRDRYIAGMGFSNVGLGIAHSMAHTLGAVYDTPHGVACAMMLPIVMEYNQECTGEKYREIARAMGVKGVDEMSQDEYRKAAIEAVKKLSVDVGIPTKLEAIKEEDLQFLAESAHADACAPGNPKDASVEDLKDLFRKIM